jgi:hypothetical protein
MKRRQQDLCSGNGRAHAQKISIENLRGVLGFIIETVETLMKMWRNKSKCPPGALLKQGNPLPMKRSLNQQGNSMTQPHAVGSTEKKTLGGKEN